MGQKVNPISLRLQQTNRHFDSSWYSDYFYSELIIRDLKLQNYFNSILKQLEYPRGRFFIQNFQNKLKIHLFFCNPKVSRNSRSAFFRLPKPRLKSRLKAKNLKINKMVTSNMTRTEFSTIEKIIDGNKRDKYSEQNVNNMKDVTIRLEQSSLPSKRLSMVTTKDKMPNKEFIFDSSNNFLTTYSLQNKKQSIFLFYLFQNLKNNFFLNFDSRMANQKASEDNLQQSEKSKNYLGIDILYLNQLLIRYTILNSFILCQSNLIVNKYILLFKSKLFKWFTKKYIVFLILNYVKFKLYNYQTKSKHNGDSNRILLVEKLFKNSVKKKRVKVLSHEEKKIYPYNVLDETISTLPIQKEKTLQALLKMINKQAAKNINQRRHKINNLFFKPQFQTIKTINSLQNKIQATNECFISKVSSNKVDFLTREFSNHRDGISAFKRKTNRIYKNNKKNFVLKNSDFREHLESLLSSHFNLTVNTFFYLVSKESQCALFLADEIAYYLEKRVSFRAIKNKIMKEIQQSEHPFFKGIRITCSGRVGGKSKKAQRSKTQTFKYGQTSLHVFSSKIDFAFKNANTSFGQVGVKIWVCYDVISPQPVKINP